MKRQTAILVGLAVSVTLAAPVYADDFLPPDWRGKGGTSWVQYEFLNDDPNPEPDNGFTPFGPPSLVVNQGTVEAAVPTQVSSWFSLNPPYNPNANPNDPSGYGWWNAGHGIDVYMPNSPRLNPHKEIWLQLTWATQVVGNVPGIVVEHPFGTTPLITTPLVRQVVFEELPGENEGLKVYHDVYHIDLHPNPPWELIRIAGDVDIDGIVIDTWCVPEPASMALLALGSLLLRRRR